jgi:hypothetical protein
MVTWLSMGEHGLRPSLICLLLVPISELRLLGAPQCSLFNGLANPYQSILEGWEDLVFLKDRPKPCLDKPLAVKLRLWVLVRQEDQHGDQLAVHQHQPPVFLGRASFDSDRLPCHLNHKGRSIQSIRLRHKWCHFNEWVGGNVSLEQTIIPRRPRC